MLTTQTKEYPLPADLQAKIDLVLESHDNDPTQIVGILLDVQDLHERHYVPEPTAYYLADRLGIPVTNVFDCLNFYSELSSTPRAKYPIQVCSSPACRVNRIDTERLTDTMEKLTIDGPAERDHFHAAKFCLKFPGFFRPGLH